MQVFLCHASDDKGAVRRISERLRQASFDPWLDVERLRGGQEWDIEIRKAVRASAAVVVCLSKRSTTKEGYVQKEIRFALDVADEKPDGTIYIIPLRLDDCAVPERLRKWQWIDYFADDGFEQLVSALRGDTAPMVHARNKPSRWPKFVLSGGVLGAALGLTLWKVDGPSLDADSIRTGSQVSVATPITLPSVDKGDDQEPGAQHTDTAEDAKSGSVLRVRVTAKVVNSTGLAVPNATIYYQPRALATGERPLIANRTGIATIELAPGTYLIWAGRSDRKDFSLVNAVQVDVGRDSASRVTVQLPFPDEP